MKKEQLKSIIIEEITSMMKENDIENQIQDLIDLANGHNFGFEYASGNEWRYGRQMDTLLRSKVDDLVKKVPADELYQKLLNGVKEQYQDGRAHKTIGYWFKKHL